MTDHEAMCLRLGAAATPIFQRIGNLNDLVYRIELLGLCHAALRISESITHVSVYESDQTGDFWYFGGVIADGVRYDTELVDDSGNDLPGLEGYTTIAEDDMNDFAHGLSHSALEYLWIDWDGSWATIDVRKTIDNLTPDVMAKIDPMPDKTDLPAVERWLDNLEEKS